MCFDSNIIYVHITHIMTKTITNKKITQLPTDVLLHILHLSGYTLNVAMSCKEIYSLRNIIPIEKLHINDIIENNEMSLLKWACKDRLWEWTDNASKTAILQSVLPMLQFIMRNGATWHPDSLMYCLSDGLRESSEIFKWSAFNGAPWCDEILDVIARKGNMDLLQWVVTNCDDLADQDSDDDDESSTILIFDDVLDINAIAPDPDHAPIKHILVERKPVYYWGRDALYTATVRQDIDMVKYMVANGCPLNTYTYTCDAADSGSIELLEWALETGCTWHPYTTAAAAEYGHISVIEWAVSKGYTIHLETQAILDELLRVVHNITSISPVI